MKKRGPKPGPRKSEQEKQHMCAVTLSYRHHQFLAEPDINVNKSKFMRWMFDRFLDEAIESPALRKQAGEAASS